MQLKEEVNKLFNSSQALKSPPHITLHMPFRLSEKKQEKLEEVISNLNQSFDPFDVTLNSFGFFEPKVVYVQVNENTKLRTLQQNVQLACRKDLKLLNANYKDQVFRPHITIAFRDLKKPAFALAKAYYEKKPYNRTFRCENLSLLKHNGSEWDVYR